MTMPYRGRWTKEQLAEVHPRITRLRDALTDPVNLLGHTMYLDEGTIAHLACHLAFAGADVDESAALIEYRLRPADNQMFRDTREWKPLGEFGDEPPPPSRAEIDKRAAEERERIKKQIPPDVLEQYRQQMAREYEATMRKDAEL